MSTEIFHDRTLWAKILVLVLVFASLMFLWPQRAAAATIDVTNNVPKKNPCKDMKDDVYKEFRDALDKALADNSGVLKDIQAQIDDSLKKADLKPKKIEVEIFFVTLDEFVKEYAEDIAQDKEKSAAAAKDKFDKLNAYTYRTDKGTIKIKIFCKRGVIDATIDNGGEQHPLYRLIVHELVHAKLFSMTLSGLPQDKFPENLKKEAGEDNPPAAHPGDHNDQFSKEVDRLLDRLLKEEEKQKDKEKEKKLAAASGPLTAERTKLLKTNRFSHPMY